MLFSSSFASLYIFNASNHRDYDVDEQMSLPTELQMTWHVAIRTFSQTWSNFPIVLLSAIADKLRSKVSAPTSSVRRT